MIDKITLNGIDYPIAGGGGAVTGITMTCENGLLSLSVDGTVVASFYVGEAPAQYDAIASYFREDVLRVAHEINELSDEWQSFIVLTDTHLESNHYHSIGICNFLLRNTKANKLFMLGDLSDGGDAEIAKAKELGLFKYRDQVYFAVGNHDVAGLTAEDYYSLFLQGRNFSGNPEGMCYYFDDDEHKIRYLVINTEAAYTTVNQSTVQAAVAIGSDWSLIVFGHRQADPDNTESYLPYSSADALYTDLVACTGTIVGYFAGHLHTDTQSVIGDNDYYQSQFEADVIQSSMTGGTNNEQAITLVSVNTVKNYVVFRRIGLNDSSLSSMNYVYPPGSAGTFTVTNTLTHMTSDNTDATVSEASAYSATITADTDYMLSDGCSVVMDGIDITDEVLTVNDSYSVTIAIPCVTGDLVITVTGEAEYIDPGTEDSERLVTDGLYAWDYNDISLYTVNPYDGYDPGTDAARTSDNMDEEYVELTPTYGSIVMRTGDQNINNTVSIGNTSYSGFAEGYGIDSTYGLKWYGSYSRAHRYGWPLRATLDNTAGTDYTIEMIFHFPSNVTATAITLFIINAIRRTFFYYANGNLLISERSSALSSYNAQDFWNLAVENDFVSVGYVSTSSSFAVYLNGVKVWENTDNTRQTIPAAAVLSCYGGESNEDGGPSGVYVREVRYYNSALSKWDIRNNAMYNRSKYSIPYES